MSIAPGIAELRCGAPEEITVIRAMTSGGLPRQLAFVAVLGSDGVTAGRELDRFNQSWLVVSGRGFRHRILPGWPAETCLKLPCGHSTDAWLAILREADAGREQETLVPAGAELWRADGGNVPTVQERGPQVDGQIKVVSPGSRNGRGGRPR